jgi:hypothetical protein
MMFFWPTPRVSLRTTANAVKTLGGQSKKWNLVNDFTDYKHSSASFYEIGIKKHERIVHINKALYSKLPGSRIRQKPAR